MQKFKLKMYNLIRNDKKNNLAGNIFNTTIITLIILNVILVIMDTFKLPLWFYKISHFIEVVSMVIFLIEYLMRLWTATLVYPNLKPYKARLKYILSFMAIIDFLSIIPFFIPFIIPVDLRVLRMLRLLRLFKVGRYTNSLSQIASIFKRKAGQLMSSMFVVLLLMIIASVLMYNIEHTAQPDKFANALDGLWWAVATLTTVGYGDIFPVTALGKILSGIIALLGIGLIAVPTGIISVGFMESIGKPKETAKKHYCPYCGEKIK